MSLPPALTFAACGSVSILFSSLSLNSMLIDAPLSRYSVFAGKPAQLTQVLVSFPRDLMKLITFLKVLNSFFTVVTISDFTVNSFFFLLFLRFFFGFNLAISYSSLLILTNYLYSSCLISYGASLEIQQRAILLLHHTTHLRWRLCVQCPSTYCIDPITQSIGIVG